MRFQIYIENGLGLSGHQCRWRLWSVNNKIVANSGEGYHNLSDCRAAIRLVMNTGIYTPVL